MEISFLRVASFHLQISSNLPRQINRCTILESRRDYSFTYRIDDFRMIRDYFKNTLFVQDIKAE